MSATLRPTTTVFELGNSDRMSAYFHQNLGVVLIQLRRHLGFKNGCVFVQLSSQLHMIPTHDSSKMSPQIHLNVCKKPTHQTPLKHLNICRNIAKKTLQKHLNDIGMHIKISSKYRRNYQICRRHFLCKFSIMSATRV
jgi:hypothetical protein